MSRSVLAAFLPVAAAHLGLLLVWDLRGRLVMALTLIALASLALWAAVRRLRDCRCLSLLSVVAGAAILRLLLLPIPLSLSDDAHRYIWDGRVAGAGLNPYVHSPEDTALEALRDDRWRRLPHRDVPTVYPPLAMALFAVAARFPAPVAVLKVVLVGADLLVVALLVRIADRRAVERRRILWYAWHPLVGVEVAGMAHVDVLGVAAVALTVLALGERIGRPFGAGAAAAAAILAKLVPAVAWPCWLRHSGRPARFAIVSVALVATALLPVVAASQGLPPGYVRFGVSWEFNGPLFEPLWRLLDGLEVREAIAAALDAVKGATSADELVNRLYPLNYPQFSAKLLLAAASVPFFLWAWRSEDAATGTGRALGVLLVFSATVYPWYVLWILPWAALGNWRAWLVVTAVLPLSYLPQFSEVSLFPWVWSAIWIPFFIMVARNRRWFAA